MINYILFDDYSWQNLLPITFTRPVCEIRIGILTIKEKWEHYLKVNPGYITQSYLSKKYSHGSGNDNILINGKISPNKELIALIQSLKTGESIKRGNDLIAYRTETIHSFNAEELLLKAREVEANYISVKDVWDIFAKNEHSLKADFELLTTGRETQNLSSSNIIIGDKNLIFLEEGAIVEASVINTNAGPVYIRKNAEVMEGSLIRGPFSLGEQSTLKLGTKIYGATTVGPHCKIGGEVNNSVILGYSNKGHDGFLGNSVIGEWCNLGADTNSSNLKNNYGNVKLYNYKKNKFIDTGLQFCGLIMGDHSKCGINTMFNTGTVVGVGANIFGTGFPETHIPSFTWGGATNSEKYKLDKMIETARLVLGRRGLKLSNDDTKILNHIFEVTYI